MNTVSEVTTSRETSPSTAAAVRRRVQVPRVDVRESSDAFQIVADVPGVAADGVEVTVEENVLSVIARTSHEAPNGYRQVYGNGGPTEYRRAFHLSEKVAREGIAATLKNGTLILQVPKAREAQPRRISVQAA